MKINTQGEYDNAKDAYYNSASQDECNRAYIYMEDKYDNVKSAHTLQMISAGAALTVYLYNLIDAAMTKPKSVNNYRFGVLHIEPKIKKNYSAIFVNVRF